MQCLREISGPQTVGRALPGGALPRSGGMQRLEGNILSPLTDSEDNKCVIVQKTTQAEIYSVEFMFSHCHGFCGYILLQPH